MSGPAQPAHAPLRWRRAMIFSVIVGTILFAVAWAPLGLQRYENYRDQKASEPRPIPASDAEQIAIVRAVFATGKLQGVPLPPPELGEVREGDTRFLLLTDTTVTMRACGETQAGARLECFDQSRIAARLLHDEYELREIPLKLRGELVLANRESTAMPDPGVAGARHTTTDTHGWDNRNSVHPDFPDTSGILAFSRAVVSQDGKQALIYSHVLCGMLCGSGYVFLLERKGDAWVVAREFMLWIS